MPGTGNYPESEEVEGPEKLECYLNRGFNWPKGVTSLDYSSELSQIGHESLVKVNDTYFFPKKKIPMWDPYDLF